MTVFFVSDTHFHHANMLRFTREDGSPVRPDFSSAEEMNESMIERWNSVVGVSDKVYHLGDVSFKYGRELSEVMHRLRGKKRLLLGNHDRIKGTNLIDYFEKVELWRIFKDEGFVCSHIPLNHENFRAKVGFNVHGHVHHRSMEDPRYVNVSVEVTDYRPLSMDEVLDRIRGR